MTTPLWEANQMNNHNIDRDMGHDYDGIREYDNKLPNWWLATFYGAIVFAVIYWLVFHTLEIRQMPIDDYNSEMQKAAEVQLARMSEGGLTNESLELMTTISERVETGRALYAQYCTVCHLEKGQGTVGPNLTDQYWVNGGMPLDIHRTVTEGVPQKGMAAWGRQLGPRRVDAVVAYILTLRNTNIPGKAPEGTLFDPQPTPATPVEETPLGDDTATPPPGN
jgi:cytochrome c oxidase cbb3-type subunit III